MKRPDAIASGLFLAKGYVIEQMHRMFEDAAVDAAKNYQSSYTLNPETVSVDENGNIQASYRGKNKYGIEVYETSEEIKKVSYKERMDMFISIMEEQYRGRTAKFNRNGHSYYALFESDDVSKNVYGDKKSDRNGWKAKINAGAEGNIFELVENSRYDGSKKDNGKKIASHKDVGYWDYFIKIVQIDNRVYDPVANVRKKPDNSFVYSIQLNENKIIEASPSLGLLSKASNRMLNASDTDSTTPSSEIQEENQNSTRNPNAISDRTLLANALESTAQNDIEKKYIADYKANIDKLEELQAHLDSGKDAADKYLDEMTVELNRRATVKRTEAINEADGLEKVMLNKTDIFAILADDFEPA